MATNYPNASMIRRVAAIVYDLLIIICGLWLGSTIIIVVIMNNDEIISGPPLSLFLYFEMFLFYFIFWRIKGQTLGMQVWKIRVVNLEGEIVSSGEAFMRFFWATLTIIPGCFGFIWMRFNSERITLYDKMSETRVIYLGDKPYESEKQG